MKKFVIALLAMIMLSVPAFAFRADVQKADVFISNIKQAHACTKYPILVYRDVTYFPMTYEYARMFGLVSAWDGKAFYLSYCPSVSEWPENIEWAPEVDFIEARPVDCPVYVNGRLYEDEEYPLFIARDIIYFPMTVDFARRELGIDVYWDGSLVLTPTGGNWQYIQKIEDNKVYFKSVPEILKHKENGMVGFSQGTYYVNHIFDADAGIVSENEDDPEIEYDYRYYKDVREKLRLEGTALMYENIFLSDIADYLAKEAERENPRGINIFGTEYELGGGKRLLMVYTNYTTEFAQPKPVGRAVSWYILDGETAAELDPGYEIQFRSAEYIDGTIWLCLQNLGSYWWGSYYGPMNYELYTVSGDNTLVPLTDPDHSNIELLGQMGGKPVVKATWKSERTEVALINDGYFTVEPDGSFNKIYHYLYCDNAVVVNDRLYLLSERLNAVIDVLADEEISY